MSQNFSPSPMQPLSIGNVVTAGLRIYRSHLKSYFLLALKAYVWLLVPVYGWAKFCAISGLLSRLVFGELINQPESIESGSRYVNSKLWQFLLTTILMFLIGLGIGIGFIILSGVLVAFIGGLSSTGNTVVIAIATLVAIVAFIALLVGLLWLLARFFVVELPLALEDNINASTTIGRSWELTKEYAWRILGISFIAFLITLPIQIAVQIFINIIQIVYAFFLQQNSPLFAVPFVVLFVALSFLGGAVVLPFWQAIKAVVYYDLRTRREGLGLKLRDRNI